MGKIKTVRNFIGPAQGRRHATRVFTQFAGKLYFEVMFTHMPLLQQRLLPDHLISPSSPRIYDDDDDDDGDDDDNDDD